MALFRFLLILILFLPGASPAQDLSALARVDAGRSAIASGKGWVRLELALSQPVPWRARVLADPPRLVLDFREVDWTGIEAVAQAAGPVVTGWRAGVYRPGWSRLVLELDQGHVIQSAELATGAGAGGGGALLRLSMAAALEEVFRAAASQPEPPEWQLQPVVAPPAGPVPRGEGPLILALDPGHGGIDPGAEAGRIREKDLVLKFARELREALMASGGFEVVLTRDADVFVPLEARISIARAAGAHVFLSLHADALADGEAQGITLYHLDEGAKDAAAAALAERHDRDDLLAGVDLTAQDDALAQVLIDMARTETTPRTLRLSRHLDSAIAGAGLRRHKVPEQGASFSVLKSPDIPSLLIELGFMSSQADLGRMQDKAWRAALIKALIEALRAWDAEDQALRRAAATQGN